MWWMWHGDVGHWVINQTPGIHGGDRMKSIHGDFSCPQNKPEWEGPASSQALKIDQSQCCKSVLWRSKNNPDRTFVRTNRINSYYPVYQTEIDGEPVYMWWMWHGTVGHWVINKTPGSHGNDIIKSNFTDVVCPAEIDYWDDPTSSIECLGRKYEMFHEPDKSVILDRFYVQNYLIFYKRI